LDEIPSPCIRNCCLDQDDICMGCFRTLEDILEWGSAPDEQKVEIISLANKRKSKYQQEHLMRQTQSGDKGSDS